ncbi:MAG: hypothetical protein RBU30_06720, partial [Polyangia bacterium]|nr:hypothetical protein [Polyangia bacterium]
MMLTTPLPVGACQVSLSHGSAAYSRARAVWALLALVGLVGCGPTTTGNDRPDASRDAVAHGDGSQGDGAPWPDAQTCTDDCAEAGQKACGEGGIVECGNWDADPCLDWSAAEPCEEGLRCDPETLTCREPCGDFCEPFSIVLLPDTQYYTSKQSNNASNTYRKQAQWIVDHQASDAIKFVVHLGDITNSNTQAQWQIASDAHALLDAAAIPYS